MKLNRNKKTNKSRLIHHQFIRSDFVFFCYETPIKWNKIGSSVLSIYVYMHTYALSISKIIEARLSTFMAIQTSWKYAKRDILLSPFSNLYSKPFDISTLYIILLLFQGSWGCTLCSRALPTHFKGDNADAVGAYLHLKDLGRYLLIGRHLKYYHIRFLAKLLILVFQQCVHFLQRMLNDKLYLAYERDEMMKRFLVHLKS